jgi:hypothetical protein
MPNARWLAAAVQYAMAQGRHGTTHPRAVPSTVRGWVPATERIISKSPDRSDNFVLFLHVTLLPHRGTLVHES